MDLQASELAALSPDPDRAATPDGFVVEMAPGERIHFLDWGGPEGYPGVGVLLIHGLGGTAWGWTAVARRSRRIVPTVAVDLRGHGLSDAPTTDYDPTTLAEDIVAVADGSGLLRESDAPAERDRPGEGARPGRATRRRVVLAGHGYGAIVATWAADLLGDRCAGLVLVDGGWQDVAEETGLTPAEYLRDLAEPPEVLASMDAFLADRRAWDPTHWDPDEDQAARATVVEVPAGHVVPAVRPHAFERSVEAIFRYLPVDCLVGLAVPIVALVAVDDEERTKTAALAEVQVALAAAGRPPIEVARFPDAGHNLPRYRPDELAGAILRLAVG